MRKLTGSNYETIVRPWVLCFQEPICLVLNAYTALICVLLFAWLESFPIVFRGIYGFNQGEVGLAFLGLLCGAILALCLFFMWFYMTESKKFDSNCRRIPEKRFIPLMAGCWLIPISLFVFGWGANPHVHWIVPIIGSGLFSIGGFSVFVSSFLLSSHLAHVQKLMVNADLDLELPPRHLSESRSLGPGGQYISSLYLWLRLCAYCCAHVQSNGASLGE